jgi:hypothetical protein
MKMGKERRLIFNRSLSFCSSNARADVMMLGPTESRSSLRGKTFGERALPGKRKEEKPDTERERESK